MRPLDPRLLRHARATRRYLALTTVLGLASTVLIVVQAVLLARVIAGVVTDGKDVDDVRGAVGALLVVVVARAALAGVQERFGHRAAGRVVGQLRRALLDHAVAGVGDPAGGEEGADLALLATRGLDGLDGYLTRYLPQLLLASTLTPALLAVVWWYDRVAGLTITLTLPLVPLFMALVGLSSQAAAERSLARLQALGSQVLDLVAGLPTLRALGQAAAPLRRVRTVAEAYRRTTMRTLRSAFLSALVLEALTTLSVALVAVGVGLRLVAGDLDLRTGLVVLLLAPEVYLPLRQVGMHFHASVDGLAAATSAFEVLERPLPALGERACPDLGAVSFRFEGVAAEHPGGRAAPARLDLEIRPGEIVALTGPSGCGKSTTVAMLLGLRRPDQGRITLRTTADPGLVLDLQDVAPAGYRAQVAWVPQHPALVPGTLEENVRLATGSATPASIRAAATVAGLDEVVAGLPDGWSTRIGQGGTGLSAGQRQRLALTRVLLGRAALVVLDEPTAHLDAGAEQVVLDTLSRLRAAGRTVVLVAHRPALAALADRQVAVTGGRPAALTGAAR
jgi:ATP-binding cassette, subfamily C, bacterial CydD